MGVEGDHRQSPAVGRVKIGAIVKLLDGLLKHYKGQPYHWL